MKTHKFILAIELIFLALPITGLFSYFGFFNVIGSILGRPLGIGYPIFELLVTILIFVLLYSLWKLAYILYRKDKQKFINSNGFLWAALIIGIAYSAIGIIAFISWYSPLTPLNDLMVFNLSLMFFKYGIWGVPLIVPAIHLIFIHRYFLKYNSEQIARGLNDS